MLYDTNRRITLPTVIYAKRLLARKIRFHFLRYVTHLHVQQFFTIKAKIKNALPRRDAARSLPLNVDLLRYITTYIQYRSTVRACIWLKSNEIRTQIIRAPNTLNSNPGRWIRSIFVGKMYCVIYTLYEICIPAKVWKYLSGRIVRRKRVDIIVVVRNAFTCILFMYMPCIYAVVYYYNKIIYNGVTESLQTPRRGRRESPSKFLGPYEGFASKFFYKDTDQL